MVARDGGEVPQETSAFITVRLTDAAWGAAGGEITTTRRPSTAAAAATRQLKMVYFSRKNSVPEDLPVGRPFAKLVLTDAAIVEGLKNRPTDVSKHFMEIIKREGKAVRALQGIKTCHTMTISLVGTMRARMDCLSWRLR